jgi:hypothetical protein
LGFGELELVLKRADFLVSLEQALVKLWVGETEGEYTGWREAGAAAARATVRAMVRAAA